MMTRRALRDKMVERRERMSVAKKAGKRFLTFGAVLGIILALGAGKSGPARSDFEIKGLHAAGGNHQGQVGHFAYLCPEPGRPLFCPRLQCRFGPPFPAGDVEASGHGNGRRDPGRESAPARYRGASPEIPGRHPGRSSAPIIPTGEEIVSAFVKGINAYVDLTRKDRRPPAG